MPIGVITHASSNPYDWEMNENAQIHQPKALRPAKYPHRWVKGDRETPGHYERVELAPIEERQYPKMLYHPEYGKQRPPDPNDFETAQKFRVAQRAYAQTNFQRTLTVEGKKEEEKWTKAGWLATPPSFGAPTINRKEYGEL